MEAVKEIEEIDEDPTEKYLREYCQDFSKIQDENGVDLHHLWDKRMNYSPFQRVQKSEVNAPFICKMRSKSPFYPKHLPPLVPAPFLKILAELYQNQVEYVLIGAVAMVTHGSCYVTGQLDISISPTDKQNTQNAQTILADYLSSGQVHIYPTLAGIASFEELWEHAEIMDFGDFTVRAASIDDLITMKKATNRLHDQLHVMELQALKKLIKENEENHDATP
jgi:hypothetical protein